MTATKPTPRDYSAANHMDFSIKCTDGKLKFSKYLLSSQTYFAAMLNSGTKESITNQLEIGFDMETMNVILNYLDPINGFVKLPDDVYELSLASHQFMLSTLLNHCRDAILANPKNKYLELTELIFPEIHIKLLSLLLDKKLLTGCSRETYLQLFKINNPVEVAELYVADGHQYSSDIVFKKDHILPIDDYVTLAKIFNTKEASNWLLEIAIEQWKHDRLDRWNSSTPLFDDR